MIVPKSFVQNRPQMEMTQMSINGWMNKQNAGNTQQWKGKEVKGAWHKRIHSTWFY